MSLAQGALRPMTMWWTAGSEQIEPCVLLSRALPRTDSFSALLAGTWNDGRWDGVISSAQAPVEEALEPDIQLQFESGAASDPGTVREQNQDHFLAADDHRLWAVADGMGGHSHGEVASQMVVDALSAMEAPSTLNAVFQAMTVSLAAVNSDLRRGALGTGERAAASGSTVVALVIRGGEWGVAWAGDSRAYLWRNGELLQLTQDHSVGAADAPPGAPAGNGAITRAVGGHDNLELDFVADLVAVDDRFLICSDGLYVTLDPSVLAGMMRVPLAQDAAKALIEAAREAGAKDNITAVVVDVKLRELDT
jgi:protein phosphatase